MIQNTAGINNHNFPTQQLEGIYLRYYPALVYFASTFIDSTEAEEIVNDTFIKLLDKQPGHFADEQSLKAFLYILTRNACFNLLRRTKNHSLDDYQLKQLYYTEEVMERTEILSRIKQEVDALPASEKQVMQLVQAGKKQAEIAEIMELDVEKVKAIRRKAIARLRIKLLDKGIPLLYIYLLFKEN